MKHLVIHIGSHKTGTTAIQDVLAADVEYLNNHRCYYPAHLHRHNVTLEPILRSEPYDAFSWKLNYKKKEVFSVAAKYKKLWSDYFECVDDGEIIVSSEFFFLNGPIVSKNLKQMVSAYFDRFTIIAYIRHPMDYIISQLQQSVRNGWLTNGEMVTDLYSSFNYILNKELKYRLYVNTWQEVFGRENVKVRPFDKRVFKNGNLITDFFATIGRPDIMADDLAVQKRNESIGMNSVLFLSEYNKYYPVFVNGRLNKGRGLAHRDIPIWLFERINEPKFTLDLRFTAQQAAMLNEEIDFANSLFDGSFQFEKVTCSDEPMTFPSIDDVPHSFYVELFNEYNKELAIHLDGNDNLYDFKLKALNAYAETRKKRQVRLKNIRDYLLRSKIGVDGFDPDYYLKQYPDVKDSKMNPWLHYHFFGAHEGRNPGIGFNTINYIAQNPSIIASGTNPLIHQLNSI